MTGLNFACTLSLQLNVMQHISFSDKFTSVGTKYNRPKSIKANFKVSPMVHDKIMAVKIGTVSWFFSELINVAIIKPQLSGL